MKPILALVRYTTDKTREVVNVSDITKFNPKTVNDFNAKQVYQVECSVVQRSDSDLHDLHFKQSYPAKILLLGASNDSMVASAKRQNEKLPPGYAERVKKEKMERSSGESEKKKTAKEVTKALRRADQARMDQIFKSNLKINDETIGKTIDTNTTNSTSNSTHDTNTKVSEIVVSPSKTVTVESNTHELPPSPEPKEELNEVSLVHSTQNDHKSPAKKDVSALKPDSPMDISSKIPSSPELTLDGISKPVKRKSSGSADLVRNLFNSKRAKRDGTERDSDDDTVTSATCSYQSSTFRFKELEDKVVKLQLQNQCLKKHNTMLSKCLSTVLSRLNVESDNIQNILNLHGHQNDITQEIVISSQPNTNWVVSPSPAKIKSIENNGKVSQNQSSIFPSTHSPMKKPDSDFNQDSTTPKKVFEVTSNGASSTPKKSPKPKSPENPKKSPKSPKSTPGTDRSEKSKKIKEKSKKLDSGLQPGEVKAEIICNDLLKVLKKEREAQMNEEKTKICIGNNTWLKNGVWKDKFSKRSTNMRAMVNDLAEEVWGLEMCGQMSLAGGKSPRNPNAPRKPPAPAGKVEAIFGLCRAHFMWQGMTNSEHLDASVHQCREFLRTKFNEAARKIKRLSQRMKQDKEKEDSS